MWNRGWFSTFQEKKSNIRLSVMGNMDICMHFCVHDGCSKITCEKNRGMYFLLIKFFLQEVTSGEILAWILSFLFRGCVCACICVWNVIFVYPINRTILWILVTLPKIMSYMYACICLLYVYNVCMNESILQ